jgi:hypothetical protein
MRSNLSYFEAEMMKFEGKIVKTVSESFDVLNTKTAVTR